jgi:predicted O-methyltransferase YrrM
MLEGILMPTVVLIIIIINLILLLNLIKTQKKLITQQNDFQDEVKKSFQESSQLFNAEIKRVNEISVQQIESLFSIFFTLEPKFPLPTMRGWAASPDLLKEIISLTHRQKPQLVVEASSGVSTLIIAYCLKRLGSGKLISLEHEQKFAQATQNNLLLHGLDDIATVIHAPLVEVEINNAINNTKWLWYDLTKVEIPDAIDMLIVDGPPGTTQKLARYPALPLLHEKLSSDAIIILDDGARSDEGKIVKQWMEEFKMSNSEYISLEKGAYLIYQ